MSPAHVSWQGGLILLGFFLHTLACILVIVAMKYCPKWFRIGWDALCVSTILVFIRRAGWAYTMIQFGSERHFFLWEYVIYCIISIGWGILGWEMIRKGRDHNESCSVTTSVTTEHKTTSRSSK